MIPSEGGTTYEECEIASNDGLAYGLVVQVIRDGQGNPFVTINQPGVGFQVGMEFTLAAGKIGGTSEDDDIVIKIKEVGETLTYRIFGDVYDKKLIDDELYPEFNNLLSLLKMMELMGQELFHSKLLMHQTIHNHLILDWKLSTREQQIQL